MTEPSFNCYTHGKLLLTGEYYVLDGAKALAVPTLMGQHFHVRKTDGPSGSVTWQSSDNSGKLWFEGEFSRAEKFKIVNYSDLPTAERVCELLNRSLELNPALAAYPALEITTRLEFGRNWGLGSSSTLVYAISAWLDIDPFQLLEGSFGGSGYDVACAGASGPVLYQIEASGRRVQPQPIQWPFKDLIHFVYLGEKQDSREGIIQFEQRSTRGDHSARRGISELTDQIIECRDFGQFCNIIERHEALISRQLSLPMVKETRFQNFNGVVKSLGAWGGDFALAASTDGPKAVRDYFLKLGYTTVISWKDMVLEK